MFDIGKRHTNELILIVKKMSMHPMHIPVCSIFVPEGHLKLMFMNFAYYNSILKLLGVLINTSVIFTINWGLYCDLYTLQMLLNNPNILLYNYYVAKIDVRDNTVRNCTNLKASKKIETRTRLANVLDLHRLIRESIRQETT